MHTRSRTALLGALVTFPALLAAPSASVAAQSGSATCVGSPSGQIHTDALFHDGGPLYLQPTEPAAYAPVTLTLRAAACDLSAATLSYRLSADDNLHTAPMQRLGRDATGRYDLWQVTIRTGAAGSALTYRFDLHAGATELWYGALGYAPAPLGAGRFTIAPGFTTPTWAQSAVYYQIFPDRFKDGNAKNDVRTGEYSYQGQPVIAQPWTALPENPGLGRDFFGGDLAGITQELNPYLKQTLGVTALYLNPIFQSLSNHKYDTQDYFRVDPHFGTNADLVALVRHAHAGGEFTGDYRMSVILDGVFNHSGDTIRWFNKENLYPPMGAYNTQKSPWYSFYTFTNWPTEYADFEGCCPQQPTLNYASAKLRAIIYRTPTSVMQTYLRPPYQIDGWRLDAADQLSGSGGIDSHAVWRDVRPYVKRAAPQGVLIGETWGPAGDWLDGTQWDGATNYNGFTFPVSEWITGKDATGNAATLPASGLLYSLVSSANALPRPAQLAMLNSLSTHDIPRFLYRAHGNAGKMVVATILQMTTVGAPTIYYGDEIGMTGATDPDDRRPFDWRRSHWNRAILDATRKLVALRKALPVLRTGSFIGLFSDDDHNGLAYGRWQAGQRVVVVLNDDSRAHAYHVPVAPVEALPGSRWRDALRGGTSITAANETVTVSLPAYSGAVLTQNDGE